MKITLVDIGDELADSVEQLGWASCEVLRRTRIEDVPREPGMVFVSPANSIGFMDGGVDLTLSRVMFPGVEARVKAAYARHGKTSRLGRKYLPIGGAVVVPTQHDGVSLVAAPTMWLPQDVRGTHNAYHATYAALRASDAVGATHVVFPGMATGFGRMSANESVAQMKQAHEDFVFNRGRVPPLVRFTQAMVDDEQRPWYENTEFKVIVPGDVKNRA